jgi:DNA-binding MarR family transcriptional regulator
VGEPRWLDDTEMTAWRRYIETVGDLAAAIEADLVPHRLSAGDYQVLVFLSEADDRRMRMCDLADRLRLSPSGLTRRLDGLVRSGLVRREPAVDDRRVALAVLTESGMARLAAAAPDHVESVRRHLFDHLDRRQVEAMADLFTTIERSLRETRQ